MRELGLSHQLRVGAKSRRAVSVLRLLLSIPSIPFVPQCSEGTIMLVKNKLQAGPIKGSIVIATNDAEFQRLVIPVTGLILGG